MTPSHILYNLFSLHTYTSALVDITYFQDLIYHLYEDITKICNLKLTSSTRSNPIVTKSFWKFMLKCLTIISNLTGKTKQQK